MQSKARVRVLINRFLHCVRRYFYRVLPFFVNQIQLHIANKLLMKNVYLTASVRTPIGRFGGTLASWSAADLGVAAATESLKRANLSPDQVQQSIWGCARQAGGGPNVARQITYRAGVPETAPAFTVNQACGSGVQAIILAAQQIMLGKADVVLAGGTESMSRVPYFAEGVRWGTRMGNAPLVDGMYRDGFNDPLSGLVMGETAENLARQYKISRDEQDNFALGRNNARTQQSSQDGLRRRSYLLRLALRVSQRRSRATSIRGVKPQPTTSRS
jgi:acetyl-CoA C-acetyltransferase